MKVAFVGDEGGTALSGLARELEAILASAGHEILEETPEDVNLVVNLTSLGGARPNYIRPNPSVFVASLMDTPEPGAAAELEELKKSTYAALVKTMSNVVVHRVGAGGEGAAAYFMTPELGFRTRRGEVGLAQAIADYVTPLASSRMVIENRLDEDLPSELREKGDVAAQSLMAFGRRLDAMNLLPSPFDVRKILSERDLRLIMKLFGIKQLSYGNLSARRDADSFWMSGRGVDKGHLSKIGSDLLLVKGYDPETLTILTSVPPGTDPSSRVSVDAIEHYKIYTSVPGVGAIVHVHAWMDGVPATLQSWPCGSEQLADEVLGLVLAAEDPTRAVIGLKNHGLTITGPSLEEIFNRIEGHLNQDVPPLE